ncbi:FadR/GntR family transcriptional regulator [Marimonas arenosa]|nr:FadR/GntR family transcriptional regulator [Marimonas arenosa]
MMAKTEAKDTQSQGTAVGPAYLSVAQRLRSFIVDERLKIGDSLPTERQLAERFVVSRHSLREALRVLQEQGILAPQQGSGNYIASTDIDLLEDHLRRETPSDATHQNQDIFEFRAMMEPEIAALAAERISDRELRGLTDIVTQQGGERNPRTLRLLDDAFHLGIARAAGNHVVSSVIRSINSVVGQVRGEVYQGPTRHRVSLAGHQEILEALAARDSGAARRAMQSHIARIRGFVMDDD